jgi:LppX_LprAFG lipoprotein
MVRSLLGVALVGAVVLVASTWGGGTLGPVASAASKTASTGAYKVDFDLSVAGAGQSVDLNGSGVADTATKAADLTFTTSGGSQAEVIVDDGVAYAKLPTVPILKPWVRLDVDELAGSQLQSLAQLDPHDWLQALLAAGQVQSLGAETVQGTPTTHYRATIDPSVLAHLPWAQPVLERLGLTAVPVDVWVDGQGLVRQEKLDFQVKGVAMHLTANLSDFGSPVSVTPPPADEVYDLTGLASKLLA